MYDLRLTPDDRDATTAADDDDVANSVDDAGGCDSASRSDIDRTASLEVVRVGRGAQPPAPPASDALRYDEVAARAPSPLAGVAMMEAIGIVADQSRTPLAALAGARGVGSTRGAALAPSSCADAVFPIHQQSL